MVEDKGAYEEVEKLCNVGDDTVVMEKAHRVEWLDLPKELWTVIAKHVNTDTSTFEIRRFRSVCKTWRSAHPSPPQHPLFAPQICIPLDYGKASLIQTKIYRLEPLSHQSQDPSISPSKGWILMLGLTESESLPLRLLNPLTCYPEYYPFRRVLNLINFRAVELIEAFTLCINNYNRVHKVVVFPSIPAEGCMVCALYYNGKIGVHKIGGKKLTSVNLDYEATGYHDIILYKERLYIMDKLGTLFWMNPSSLQLVQFSPSLCDWCCGNKKYMLERGGSLYVVNKYIDGVSYHQLQVKIYIYKLDEELGRWVNVKDLGDVVFVLGKDINFSLSAQDYYGCQGNCIYFSYVSEPFCYNLEDSKLMKRNPFWPCPTLFS